MDARKKSNIPRKSTNIPKDFLNQIETAFNSVFKRALKGRPLVVEGRIYTDEILLSIGFKPDPKGLKQVNFEASIDHDGKDVHKKVGFCVDAISSMVTDYFQSRGTVEFPKYWKDFPFEGTTVFLQCTFRNTELEAEANRILGLKTDADLMIDEKEDANREGLSILEEEDEEDESEPTRH